MLIKGASHMPPPDNVRHEFNKALEEYASELLKVFSENASNGRRRVRSEMTAAEKSALIRELGLEGYNAIPWK